jgi:cell wall assembly regulator SMI1
MNVEQYFAEVLSLARECGTALQLMPGVGEDTLVAAERVLGFRVEAAMRQAWLAHDGGREGQSAFAWPGFLTGYSFLSLRQALDVRRKIKQRSSNYAGYVQPSCRDKRILDGWYQPGWLPFASFGGTALLLMQDYSPAAKGQAGQIIAFTHDPDSIDYVAPSLQLFLACSFGALRADPEEFFMAD